MKMTARWVLLMSLLVACVSGDAHSYREAMQLKEVFLGMTCAWQVPGGNAHFICTGSQQVTSSFRLQGAVNMDHGVSCYWMAFPIEKLPNKTDNRCTWRSVIDGKASSHRVANLFPGYEGKEEPFSTDESPLKFFDTDDALKVTWYHAANSKATIKDAIEGNYMMIEADINLRWYGFPNQTNEPIMAHPPNVTSDLTFADWIDAIIESGEKGMKLDFKSEAAYRPALKLLAAKGQKVQVPVWANADIIKGPGGGDPKDPVKFIREVNELYPDVTLSIGWTTGCCTEQYTMEQMQEMWHIVRDQPQPVTFPVRAALTRPGWENLRWILDKDPERLSLTVWTSAGVTDWEGTTAWDMLYCRNDIDKSRIYFDLTHSDRWDEFQTVVITAGTPLNHFPDMGDMDGRRITWAHAVNSQDKLTQALNGDVMMLEADILLRGQGTDHETDIPVMAHPPDTDSDITLHQWLDRVIKTNKGMKLDFKSIESLEPALNRLKEKLADIQQPVFINADILQGPGGTATPVNSAAFKRIVNQVFPWATLSIGWTTGWNNPGTDPVYDDANINEMIEYIKDFNQPITFPIRAAMVKESWGVLKRLLDMSRGHSLTIWSTSDYVNVDDLVYLRKNSDKSKVFYDLPKQLMDEFLDKID